MYHARFTLMIVETEMANPALKSEYTTGAESSENELSAKEKVARNASNEFFFGVVGHIGSGTTQIADQLKTLMSSPALDGGAFDVEIVKARDVIERWAKKNAFSVPEKRYSVDTTIAMQKFGDQMRSADASAVAAEVIRKIRSLRAKKQKTPSDDRAAVIPDGSRRAYIIDSLKHPSEVELLRRVYQDAFVLIGVVCDEPARLKRINSKYHDAGEVAAKELMKNDARGIEKYGQRVSDAFHMSDFFIDNSEDRSDGEKANVAYKVGDHLSRLVKIVTHSEIVRPTTAETAMHHAYSASLRSSCLSRQVGAALIDKTGNVVATGTNDVPRAGGGLYGEEFDDIGIDQRCAFRDSKFCSNNKHQNNIIDNLIREIPELNEIEGTRKNQIKEDIKKSGVGDLIEFSRAVHAEMDALLTAGRTGTSTISCRLFVTTFPCHYCARHIVSAGIDEVQYIEPYPKSQALNLHDDSIQTSATGWRAPSAQTPDGGMSKKVLFRPFVGTAPRMYRRAFLKTRELKVRETGEIGIGQPEWGTPWHLSAISYAELEATLGSGESEE